MKSYTAREARQRWTKLFADVRDGEHRAVTFHDQNVMVCVPGDWYAQVDQALRGFNELANLLNRDPEELRRIRDTLAALGNLAPPTQSFGDLGTVDDILRRSPEELRILRETLETLRKLAPSPSAEPQGEHEPLRRAG